MNLDKYIRAKKKLVISDLTVKKIDKLENLMII